jgi:hypothetical protein
MSDLSLQRVGPTFGASGTAAPFRSDITGAQCITDSHGRFQEAALRGNLFSAGMTITSISNVTFTTATLGATSTPIIGVWNPLNSGKNLVILQARLQLITTALTTPTGPGGLMWCTSVNQGAISTGITPLNRASLASSGSIAKGFAGTALTGLSGNMVVQEASGFSTFPINATAAETAASYMPASPGGIDHIDGAFIIPPGGVLALLSTTTGVVISAASSILWEEVPLLT